MATVVRQSEARKAKSPESVTSPGKAIIQVPIPTTPGSQIKDRSSIPIRTAVKKDVPNGDDYTPIKSTLNADAKAFEPKPESFDIEIPPIAIPDMSYEGWAQPKFRRGPPGFEDHFGYSGGRADWNSTAVPFPTNEIMSGECSRAQSQEPENGNNPQAAPFRPRSSPPQKFVLVPEGRAGVNPTNGGYQKASENGPGAAPWKKQMKQICGPATRCYHCGLVGHMALDCPKKKQGIEAICFSCQQPGHKAEFCPRAALDGDSKSGRGRKEKPYKKTATSLGRDAVPMASERVRNERMKKRGKKSRSGTPRVGSNPRLSCSPTLDGRRGWETSSSNNKRSELKLDKETHSRKRRGSPPAASVWSTRTTSATAENSPSGQTRPGQPVSMASILGFLNTPSATPGPPDVQTKGPQDGRYRMRKEGEAPAWPDVHFDRSQEMMPMERAIMKVLTEARAGDTEDIMLTAKNAPQAVGRFIAKDIYVKRSLPPFPASIMDGVAVSLNGTRVNSGTCEFNFIGNIVAGDAPGAVQVRSGEAAYVTTGSPIPEGAHCVIPIEQVTQVGNVVKVDVNWCVNGNYIRPVGSDLKEGELIMQRGQKISPIDLGLLISSGNNVMTVYRKPRVGIFSTGNELIPAGNNPSKGSIFDCNSPVLASLVKREGCNLMVVKLLRDNHATIAAQLDDALKQCDIVLCSGGVSRGATDYTKKVIAERGDIHFSYLKMKPGKPTTFATLTTALGRKKYIFGLPGNPCSATVCFELLVKPAIRTILGSNAREPIFEVPLGMDLKLDQVRPEYHRAYLAMDKNTGQWGAYSTGLQRSSRARSMQGAQLLLHLPNASPSCPVLPKGTLVKAQAFGAPLDPNVLISLNRIRSVTSNAPPGIVARSNDYTVGILNVESGSCTKLVMREVQRLFVGQSIGFRTRETASDDMLVKQSLQSLVNQECDMIITIGGSGLKTKDCVPAVTAEFLTDATPQMITAIAKQYNGPRAQLAAFRGTAGVHESAKGGRTLIMNLPGEERFLKYFIESCKFVKNVLASLRS